MAGQQEAMTGDKARLTQFRKLSGLLEGQQNFFMLAVHIRKGLLFTLSSVLGGQMSPLLHTDPLCRHSILVNGVLSAALKLSWPQGRDTKLTDGWEKSK